MFIKHALSLTSPTAWVLVIKKFVIMNAHDQAIKNPGKRSALTDVEDVRETPMFVLHRYSNNKVKTFLIKRACVRKEIGPCFTFRLISSLPAA